MVEKVTTSGPISYWDFSYWAVDFILEAGAWKIWHMLDLNEIGSQQGQSLTGAIPMPKEDPAFAAMSAITMPEPTKPCTLRKTYDAQRAFSPSPRVPEPYHTFAETFSYGA